ncbi:unnamed protein product, partial [Ixodes hexagonus]
SYKDAEETFFSRWLHGAFLHQMSLIHDQKDVLFDLSAPIVSYMQTANWAAVGPGLLQPPIFIKDGPDAFNYGSLGQLVMSVLMRGYDEIGSQIDDKGYERTWWTNATRKAYAKTLNCLRNSHGWETAWNDTMPPDMFAEVASLSVAYKAFQKLPGARRRTVLPGRYFSPDQTFFLAHCSKLCGISDSATSGGRPERIKCIVPLMHEAQFAKAFDCPAGSTMNPEKRCFIW